VVNIVIAKSNN